MSFTGSLHFFSSLDSLDFSWDEIYAYNFLKMGEIVNI